jgi:tripartite-type tricarboxylate transporter receptor subunit TctC
MGEAMNNRRECNAMLDVSVRIVAVALFASGVWAMTNSALAEYPERPVRFIVPSAAGGGPDATARILAAELTRQLNQQFVVDNRAGASGMIGTEMIAKAAPDGYTIGLGNVPTLGINRSVLPSLPYDPDRDLQPVVQTHVVPNLLAVTLSLPVKSVPELIDYARKNPDKLFFASSGSGTSMHMSGEMFKIMTGTQMVHVPYKAASLAITELIAGQVQLMFDNMQSIGPHVKAGRLRGLGVTTLWRSSAFPELPPLSEAGVPGFDVTVWAGVIVPGRVSKSIVDKLNREINKALAVPSVKEKFAGLGYELVGGTPEQFAAYIKKEVAKWAAVAKRTGAKVD